MADVDDRLIDSLTAAVNASPADVPLRLHLAELLLSAGRGPEAVQHAAVALTHDPDSGAARALMTQALSPAPGDPTSGQDVAEQEEVEADGDAEQSTPATPTAASFDWHAAEADLGDVDVPVPLDGPPQPLDPASAYRVQDTGLTLEDVGGLADVKKRLRASFLAPLKNPALRAAYGKSLRGGLLLYGPPGVGKTYLAKAIAGELNAAFLEVALNDILDMYLGTSERNLHEVFEAARASTPCVLFLDEFDAIGQKRSQLRHSSMRGVVNQLLTELDGVGSDNEGVYVLAATNHPWDVDPALRRPGRLDRMVLVIPPDAEARAAILHTHLKDKPVTGVDLSRIARRTEGFSGADLAHLVETATEQALMDSAETGVVRPINAADMEQALREVRPSIGPWVETAKNVALYANASGEYDELAAWIRRFHR